MLMAIMTITSAMASSNDDNHIRKGAENSYITMGF